MSRDLSTNININSVARITTPVGPVAEGVARALATAVNAGNTANNTADFNSEGLITKGYVMGPPLDTSFDNSQVQEGQPLFIRRGDPEVGVSFQGMASFEGQDQKPFDILTLPQMNMYLKLMWDEGKAKLARHKTLRGGLPQSSLLEYLDYDENAWSELFLDDAKAIRNDDTFSSYFYMCKQGIMSRWNFLGWAVLPATADTPARSGPAYFPIPVGFKGVRKTVRNVFGKHATTTAKLFLILKRRVNPLLSPDDPDYWGAFAFHPYATSLPYVPDSERYYKGISGETEVALVIPLGFVRDARPGGITPDRLLYAQGIHPDCTPDREYEVTKVLPRLDVCIYQEMGEGSLVLA